MLIEKIHRHAFGDCVNDRGLGPGATSSGRPRHASFSNARVHWPAAAPVIRRWWDSAAGCGLTTPTRCSTGDGHHKAEIFDYYVSIADVMLPQHRRAPRDA